MQKESVINRKSAAIRGTILSLRGGNVGGAARCVAAAPGVAYVQLPRPHPLVLAVFAG